MNHLTEPWGSEEAEYDVLVQLLVPAAQARLDRVMDRWHALDTTALGFLALDAAVAAGLVAVHGAVHRAWWAPLVGYIASGAFLIASAYPRTQDLGPDLIDFHDEARAGSSLDAARLMLDHLTSATDTNEVTLSDKSGVLLVGLAMLLVSLIGSVPVALFRP